MRFEYFAIVKPHEHIAILFAFISVFDTVCVFDAAIFFVLQIIGNIVPDVLDQFLFLDSQDLLHLDQTTVLPKLPNLFLFNIEALLFELPLSRE